MQPDGSDDKGAVDESALPNRTLETRKRLWSKWPTGLTALAVIALAWVGIYLLWNGIVFLFTL